MIYCVRYDTLHHFGAYYASNLRLRYKMLVDAQYWEVSRFKGMEYDQFDTPAAAHLVWVDERGEVRGSVRATPTDRPYMLQTVFPELVKGYQLPSSLSVWEASRFLVDFTLPSEVRRRIKAELVCAFLEFGLHNDITEMIGIMPEKFWQSCFIDNGWEIEKICDEQPVDNGDLVTAGRMKISLATLKRVRLKTQVPPNNLRYAPIENEGFLTKFVKEVA